MNQYLISTPPSGDGILSIEFAPEGELARKVVSRSNMRPTGRFPSIRMNRPIDWDSPHELNAYRLLECNSDVVSFREQPCMIRYRLAGQEHKHFPDSLVVTTKEKTLWEVKTSADAKRPETVARTALMSRCLPPLGYQYALVLAEHLASEPRLRNVLMLLRYGRERLSFSEAEYARRIFADVDAVRWGDVLAGRLGHFNRAHACRLVIEGALQLNLDTHLNDESPLTKMHHAKLFGGSHG